MRQPLIVKIRQKIRLLIQAIRHRICTKIYHMDISPSAFISFRTFLDKTNPAGIHIGDQTYITSGAVIFTHDFIHGKMVNTTIGRRCFIGINAIIMPGVTIGDCVIVGAGSVVTKDVGSGCIVAGNPARVIREGVVTGRYGQILK